MRKGVSTGIRFHVLDVSRPATILTASPEWTSRLFRGAIHETFRTTSRPRTGVDLGWSAAKVRGNENVMSLPQTSRHALTRRRFLSLAGAAGVAVAAGSRPSFARGPGGGGGNGLIDPYSGSIPLRSPLASGTLQDNWHASREGALYAWSHRYARTRRAHDGVDLIPASGASPEVYSPVAGTITAVCFRETNSLDETPAYSVDPNAPPPWDYSLAADTVIATPLYGNFIWIRSSEPDSARYYVFMCHLAADPTTSTLVPGTPVTTDDLLGFVGDTGNAVGSPQLHVEIHYPLGSSFTCSKCKPRSSLTALNPYASLLRATPRA